MAQYQSLVENKTTLFNELQQKFAEQTNHLQSIQEEHLSHSNEHNKQIELLQIELEKVRKEIKFLWNLFFIFSQQNYLTTNEY
jgi:hypothetical protein